MICEVDLKTFFLLIIGRTNNVLFYEEIARRRRILQKYECEICEYVYNPEIGDPENDIAPGTPFDNLPNGWYCPTCGVDKDAFKPVSE